MIARHRSWCVACANRIHQGNDIKRGRAGWVHIDCNRPVLSHNQLSLLPSVARKVS